MTAGIRCAARSEAAQGPSWDLLAGSQDGRTVRERRGEPLKAPTCRLAYCSVVMVEMMLTSPPVYTCGGGEVSRQVRVRPW